MSIGLKTDYSFLFSSMGSSKSSSGISSSNFLADYASIKNGSYGKLMKAYYSGNANDWVSSQKQGISSSEDDSKTLASVKSSTDALKESADNLSSVAKSGDMEKTLEAVKSYVTDYNSVVKATAGAESSSITSSANNMVNLTKINSKLLGKVGITVNSDNTLQLDEETFSKADASTVKSLFGGNGSMAYRTSAQASMINYAAEREATKAATYNQSGFYNYNYNSGNIFNASF